MERLLLWLLETWRVLTHKPVRTRRYLIHVIYKGWQERYKRVAMAPEFLGQAIRTLEAAEDVRQFWIYEERFMCHKSFTEDFLPDADYMKDLRAFMAEAPIKDID
jgi:hypothetical protein